MLIGLLEASRADGEGQSQGSQLSDGELLGMYFLSELERPHHCLGAHQAPQGFRPDVDTVDRRCYPGVYDGPEQTQSSLARPIPLCTMQILYDKDLPE